jgi:hypothetical protein
MKPISNFGMRIAHISMAGAAAPRVLGGNYFHQRTDPRHALREFLERFLTLRTLETPQWRAVPGR